MNMVEKVVTQIAKLEGCNIECSHCRKIAKSAILAMREPTEEMIDAGLNRPIGVKIWTAMIDAALKD